MRVDFENRGQELKPPQNKKGQKKFPGAQFSVSFSQLPAVKKTPKMVHMENIFGPCYFVMALARLTG